jgi:galactokinase
VSRRARLLAALAEMVPDAARAPEQVRMVRAPGRVNLIGEHTDYNLGWVLPAAISLETWIASWPATDNRVTLASLQEATRGEFDAGDPGPRRGDWTDYVAGVGLGLARAGVPSRGVAAVVDSTIPIGSGLSSSAALELAAAWTLSPAVPPPLAPTDLARLAQRAENEYVGVACGLMDQFAAVHGQAGAAVLLDCRSAEHRTIALPSSLAIVVLDTNAPRQLAASQYNLRREDCERGVRLLATRYPGISSLRDVTAEMLDAAPDLLDEQTLRRCRHVVEENRRVLRAVAALEAGDLATLGRLFAESHASLRDLYEVSSPELDALVDIATSVPGVVGARMTGAGFGGCTVNLVRHDAVESLRDAVASDYPPRTGRQGSCLVVEAVNGAGLLA